jgi:outer membrane biosynthesis protein TonB
MRRNLTGKSIQAIVAAAVLFASGVWLSATGASPSGAGDAQAVGQNSGPNPSQTPGANSAARQTNRPQQNPGLPAPGQNGAVDTMYKPAQALAAGDTQYPFQTSAEGIVVFEVSVGERGEVKKTSVLVNVPPFTAAAEQSLKNWKFAPATQNGRAEDSDMLVAFAFRHAVYLANPPALNGVFPSKGSEGGRSDFIAPAILFATYAGYPASTVASGAVVVQASVKADGSTGEVTVLRDLPGGFAAMAIEAAKQWRFQSALRDGQGVPSKVAIAFVYSSRALNPF